MKVIQSNFYVLLSSSKLNKITEALLTVFLFTYPLPHFIYYLFIYFVYGRNRILFHFYNTPTIICQLKYCKIYFVCRILLMCFKLLWWPTSVYWD